MTVDQEKERWFRLKVFLLDIVIGISVVGNVWLGVNIVQMYLSKGGEYVYNCSVAEIHPNFTPAMQKSCKEQFKKETK